VHTGSTLRTDRFFFDLEGTSKGGEMSVRAPERNRKLVTRVRPHEGAAVDTIAQQKGLSVSELLRAWITAGVKGDLPIEGYLVPPAD
jgi:hypothetical protein